MNHTVALPSLSPREAAIDALHRCISAIDDNNHDLLESSIVKSEESSFSVGERKIQGYAAVDEYLTKNVLTLTTLHLVTNIRVDLKEGADTAFLTAHAVAYHIKPENSFTVESNSFTTAGLYFIDVVKDNSDGLWKIKNWTLKLNWTNGDRVKVFGF